MFGDSFCNNLPYGYELDVFFYNIIQWLKWINHEIINIFYYIFILFFIIMNINNMHFLKL